MLFQIMFDKKRLLAFLKFIRLVVQVLVDMAIKVLFLYDRNFFGSYIAMMSSLSVSSKNTFGFRTIPSI